MDDVQKLNILIIEALCDKESELNQSVRKAGFENTYCVKPRHALESFRKMPFQLVFYSIKDINSEVLTLIEQLNSMFLDIPIVVVAEQLDPRQMRRAIAAGAYDFLIKPFRKKAIPIVVTRNYERKKLVREQLRQKQSEVLMKAIKALIAAMEAKDHYTSGHSMRVVKLAMMMADRLKLNEEDRFILQLSAMLHDIGKIGMPDSILKKAASLHEMEYILVKEHPLIGSHIVGRIDELKEVAASIKHHHERYDGSGYPDGLKGEVIPLFSRILAIVDAYESLISDRIYRNSMGHNDAISELKQNAGTQFDPGLLEIFFDEIEKRPQLQNGATNYY